MIILNFYLWGQMYFNFASTNLLQRPNKTFTSRLGHNAQVLHNKYDIFSLGNHNSGYHNFNCLEIISFRSRDLQLNKQPNNLAIGNRNRNSIQFHKLSMKYEY